MGLFDIFRTVRANSRPTPKFSRTCTPDGIAFYFAEPLSEPSVRALNELANPDSPEDCFLVAYLAQLVIEERCSLTTSGVGLPWKLVYDLLASPEHAGALQWLGLPEEQPLRPILGSRDTLADPTFDVVVDGWALGATEVKVSAIEGAIASIGDKQCLLPQASWACYEAIRR